MENGPLSCGLGVATFWCTFGCFTYQLGRPLVSTSLAVMLEPNTRMIPLCSLFFNFFLLFFKLNGKECNAKPYVVTYGVVLPGAKSVDPSLYVSA